MAVMCMGHITVIAINIGLTVQSNITTQYSTSDPTKFEIYKQGQTAELYF